MNGMPFKAAKFAHSLRRALFCEHLGLALDDPSVQVKEEVIYIIYIRKASRTVFIF